jgi:hypothetical protein
MAEQPVTEDAGEVSAAAVGANAQSISRTGYEDTAEGQGAIFDPRHAT